MGKPQDLTEQSSLFNQAFGNAAGREFNERFDKTMNQSRGARDVTVDEVERAVRLAEKIVRDLELDNPERSAAAPATLKAETAAVRPTNDPIGDIIRGYKPSGPGGM